MRNVSPALPLVVHGQSCAPAKWSSSAAVEPMKPHDSPGQWHGASARAGTPGGGFPGHGREA
jgi:hypothetical protein